ncbi:ATP synthase subunit b [Durusdinium trenchii]|uniref:Chloroplastic n=1 Tax=Durusdinium trenchii TaxID=1381693 RepID=A0ABP0MWN1_9DINO
MQASKRDDHLKEKPPPMGSVHFDEQLLRKLFQKMDRDLRPRRDVSQSDPALQDLDHCEAISSKVLRHLFLQMGREIAAEELEAMITMVDMKEMGTATYEDFAAIFGNPVAAPRQSG